MSLKDPASSGLVVDPTVSVNVTVPVGFDPVSFGAHGVETTFRSATVTVKT